MTDNNNYSPTVARKKKKTIYSVLQYNFESKSCIKNWISSKFLYAISSRNNIRYSHHGDPHRLSAAPRNTSVHSENPWHPFKKKKKNARAKTAEVASPSTEFYLLIVFHSLPPTRRPKTHIFLFLYYYYIVVVSYDVRRPRCAFARKTILFISLCDVIF